MMGKLTNGMVLINVVVFLLVFSLPRSSIDSVFALFSFSPALMFQVWRLFTSLFLHASASHLFLNMIGLYFFGRIIEEELGKKDWIIVYFLSGIAGNLAYALTGTSSLVGASGCIFGLIGAAMLLKPAQFTRVFIIPLPVGLVAIIYGIAETMLAYSPAVNDNIAHIAHIAGLVLGSLFVFHRKPKESRKSILWLIVFVILLAIIGPVFGFIIGIGNAIIVLLDYIVGFVLYRLTYLISFLW